MINQALLLEIQVNCVEDIIVTRDTENFGVLRKDVIQLISCIGQENYFFQVDNHLD